MADRESLYDSEPEILHPHLINNQDENEYSPG